MKKLIPQKLLNFYHKFQTIIVSAIFGFPGRKLNIIGVTGTNGKSTVCYMISKILDEAGIKNAMLGTIYFKIGRKIWRNNCKMTFPGAVKFQSFLALAKKTHCQFVILEATSHAISQFRDWGLNYKTLVFTNITHDHLDYHGTMENYLKTKFKLFQDNPKASAIINLDDKNAGKFLHAGNRKTITYSLNQVADIFAKNKHFHTNYSTCSVIYNHKQTPLKINLSVKFNLSNALAAFAVGLEQGISSKTIKNALEKIQGIPGRMENLDFGQSYQIIIDFAHTPDGLEQVFQSIKPNVVGRLIHVGGATGNRDKTKRPILGALAGKFADVVIVTDEDPGTEKAEDIIEAVAGGVGRGTPKSTPKVLSKNFFKILNRADAIRLALENAQAGDVILITGKGHEEVMATDKGLVPYSDKKVVEEYFKK